MNLQNPNTELLVRIGIVLAWSLVLWFGTRYFYRKHKKEIETAVTEGHALPASVKEEMLWFDKSTLSIFLMAVAAAFIPFGGWLFGYITVGTIVYVVITSFVESMNRSDIRKAEYEAED